MIFFLQFYTNMYIYALDYYFISILENYIFKLNLTSRVKKLGGWIKEVLSSKCKMSVSYHFQYINSLPRFLNHSTGV